MKISNYDEFEYDYSTYWKNRNYEHFSEVIVLKKLLNKIKGKWFLDIGGSFGRHLPVYYEHFTNPIIVDYSLNTLINNKFRIWEKNPNTTLIAANVYYLPFKESSVGASMMIRVLHHIEQPDLYFNEISRVLKNESVHIQEFANKVHLKAKISHLLRRDFKFFSSDPYQQPTAKNYEGSNGVETIFLNFHPKDILNRFQNLGFKLVEKVGVSFFRIEIMKRIIPIKILVRLEGFVQSVLGKTNIAPSIFYKFKLDKKETEQTKDSKLEDILVCPKCKSQLQFKKEECFCTNCRSKFEKVADIWDFRIQ